MSLNCPQLTEFHLRSSQTYAEESTNSLIALPRASLPLPPIPRKLQYLTVRSLNWISTSDAQSLKHKRIRTRCSCWPHLLLLPFLESCLHFLNARTPPITKPGVITLIFSTSFHLKRSLTHAQEYTYSLLALTSSPPLSLKTTSLITEHLHFTEAGVNRDHLNSLSPHRRIRISLAHKSPWWSRWGPPPPSYPWSHS